MEKLKRLGLCAAAFFCVMVVGGIIINFASGNNQKENQFLTEQFNKLNIETQIILCKQTELERRIDFLEKKDFLSITEQRRLKESALSWKAFCQDRLAFLIDQAAKKGLRVR